MSIALDLLYFIVSFTNPTTVALSTCIGVGGCGWPISSRAIRRGTASFAVRYVAATSASIAEDMTLLMIFAKAYTTPFIFGGLFGGWVGSCRLLLRKNIPPARLRALSSDKYEASLAVHRIMSLLWYLMVALG